MSQKKKHVIFILKTEHSKKAKIYGLQRFGDEKKFAVVVTDNPGKDIQIVGEHDATLYVPEN